ncbi:MAG: PilZ domain-containing protein, partial [Smithellaceae bacterium]
KQYEAPELMDFRMHFRIKPPSQNRINLFFQEEKVHLIDISLGGAQFAYPKSCSFLRGDKINIKLTIDGRDFDLQAKVRHIFIPYKYFAQGSIQYVSVEFDYNNLQLETAMGRAIIEIERKLLSEGKI